MANASGPKSPYNLTRSSSVGKYQGSGLPAKYGIRRFTYTHAPVKKGPSNIGPIPSKLN